MYDPRSSSPRTAIIRAHTSLEQFTANPNSVMSLWLPSDATTPRAILPFGCNLAIMARSTIQYDSDMLMHPLPGHMRSALQEPKPTKLWIENPDAVL